MEEKNNIPKIRFKNFDENWEVKEFKEIFSNLPNNTLSRAELNYQTGLFKNVHYGDVLIKFGELLDVKNDRIPFISNDTLGNKFKLSKLQNGDIIIADTAEDENVGKCTELINVENENVVSGLHTIPVRPIQHFASKYLGYYLNSSSYHDQLLQLMQGIKVLSISKSALKSTVLVYPQEKFEQSKIGTYFQNLDKLITLQQQKHDKLVTLKKAMLDKMFPKEGADVPEIRFKGFKDKWEKRKLKEISIKVTEKNTPIRYCETFTNSAEYGIISQRDYFDNDISNSDNIDRYYVVKNDDFVYNPRISSFAPVGPINRNRLGRNGIMSPLYTVFRTQDVDVTFLEHFFKTDCWHTFMRLNGDTGARSDRFSIKDFLFVEMPIPFPKIEEQSQIGSYFQNLDKLISLHQQEIQKLKNIKKACLEKMFV